MLYAFSIKDLKAKTFSPPFYKTSAIGAIRDVIRASEDKESNLYKFPDDFALYQLGAFDEDEGIHLESEPVKLSNISEIINNHLSTQKDFSQ